MAPVRAAPPSYLDDLADVTQFHLLVFLTALHHHTNLEGREGGEGGREGGRRGREGGRGGREGGREGREGREGEEWGGDEG